MSDSILHALEKRLGSIHARQRLGIEQEIEPRIFGGGLNFFHPENWYSFHSLIRYTLKLSGLYWRGRQNSLRHRLVHNDIPLTQLPAEFDGFTILHLSDLHVDMYPEATAALVDKIKPLEYDICVLTGDYRAQTAGPVEAAVEGMEQLAAQLKSPAYCVLGNHDSIRMLPGLEQAGLTVLLNESLTITRQNARIHLAGVDDAHYFRVDNIEKAADQIPENEVSLLLSHTPEIYRQAAHAGFDMMFSGHTHGGQICLPGGYPITLDANCPRYMGSGSWKYQSLSGYTSAGAGTSIVNVRFNCPPEITLHHLRCA